MGKKPLEVFKFSLYISIPILTVIAFNTPEAMKKLLERTRYIVYPPEGPRPPRGASKEELQEALGLKRRENAKVPATSDVSLKIHNSDQSGDSLAKNGKWWKLW